MSDLGELVGREYGPFEFELSAAKVAEYVDATGDEPGRWIDYAPPSYAGAVLFMAAPALFADPAVAPYTRLLIHGEQQFEWVRPWPIGVELRASGRLERVRERGGVQFTTFAMDVVGVDGDRFVDSRSTFLMSADEPPGTGADECLEPDPESRGPNDIPTPLPLAAGTDALPPLEKSASRADLVRYAAASQDFNPIHWDHGRAVEAGLGGVVAHGLLVAAWATQGAGRLVEGPFPLADGRFRFRLPLAAGTAAVVSTTVEPADGAAVKATVSSAAGEHVAATMRINR